MREIKLMDREIFNNYLKKIPSNWYTFFPIIWGFNEIEDIKMEWDLINDNLCIFINEKEVGRELFLPPIGAKNEEDLLDTLKKCKVEEIRVDWFDFNLPLSEKIPFDVNYFYNPLKVVKLKGRTIKKVRQNVRKFKQRYERNWIYRTLKKEDIPQILSFLDSEKEDYEYTLHLIKQFKDFPELRYKVLILKNKIIALNVWGFLPDGTIDFLINKHSKEDYTFADFSRYIFYVEVSGFDLVNDGSDLDNPELRRFKEKFDPVLVKKLYSWKLNLNL